MAVGVLCEVKNECVSFEYCMSCSRCLPPQIIKSLRIFDNKPKRNVYYVSEVIGCLRKAYCDRKEGPKDRFLNLKNLYSIKRGKLFHKIVDSTGWQELEGSLTYEIDGEEVKLSARLDCYDADKRRIVELKSLENIENKRLPRKKHVLQVQSYGSIFKKVFHEIKGLLIVYLDMNNFKQFCVEQVDRTEWLKERVFALHRAIRDSKPPGEEFSYECRFCPHQKKCRQQKAIVSINHALMGRVHSRRRV